MKTELHVLTTAIVMLINTRPLYLQKDVLAEIKKESERLKILFHESFNHFTDAFVVKESMYTRYTTLVSLANALWPMEKNFYYTAALMELITLTDYMEQHYSNHLNGDYAIPDFGRFRFNTEVFDNLNKTRRLLVSKGISVGLVDKIVKAVDDFFNTGKHPLFSRADQQYLKAFLPRLHALAEDPRNKDWNFRVRQLLIQWNFNHMGVYKVLEAEQQKDALANRSYEKQHQYLYDQYFWLEQIQPETTSGYNRRAMDLKSLLLKQVESLQVHFAEVLQLKQFELLHKFGLILSVDEFAIEFKYNYDEGIFDYPHKKDAAEALCPLIRTKGTDDVSVRNLLKFDKTKLYRAAVKSFHRHCRIIEKLAKDFGIGLPE